MEIEKQLYLDFNCGKLWYERVGDVLHLHLDISYWSHSSLKLMRRIFEIFLEDAKRNGYERAVAAVPKDRLKLVSLFGGTTVDQLVINDEYVEVIVWELQP